MERIQCNTKSIYDTIKKNNFPLFRSKNSIVTNKSKQQIVILQAERSLYGSLCAACQSRAEILTTFLCMKIICTLHSISEYGNLRKCLTKFDFLVCLNGLAELIYDPPYVEMKVIDGVAFFKMNPPTTSNTYGEYCDTEQKVKV